MIVSGKRKTAIARARITEGKSGADGKITINNKDHSTFQLFDRLKLEEPIRIAKEILGNLNFDITIDVKGGGEKSQIEASRLALARAIVKFTNNKELEKAYLAYDRNLLVADVRRKEAYKPGDSKARSMRQSSKR